MSTQEKPVREVRGRLRRTLGVAGTFAATALAVSFAWSIIGGALTPPPAPLATAIVVERVTFPALPPLVPPHHALLPSLTPKFAASPAKPAAARPHSSTGGAATSARVTARAATGTAATASVLASSLLHSSSKASRTRGQPGQGD